MGRAAKGVRRNKTNHVDVRLDGPYSSLAVAGSAAGGARPHCLATVAASAHAQTVQRHKTGRRGHEATAMPVG